MENPQENKASVSSLPGDAHEAEASSREMDHSCTCAEGEEADFEETTDSSQECEEETPDMEIPFSKKRIFFLIAGILLLLIGVLLLFNAFNGSSVSALLGVPTPTPYAKGSIAEVESMASFTLSGSSGTFNPLDNLGTPALYYFFSTIGEAEAAELSALQAAHESAGEDIRFATIFTGSAFPDAEEYFSDHGITLPLYHDADGRAKKACGSPQTPITYFVDADGFVAASSTGSIDSETLHFGLGLLG